MSSKKKNPYIQLKQSKIDKIKLDATNEGLKGAIILFFSVMRDKEGYGRKRLQRVFDATTNLADSVKKGYVKMEDLEKALKDEAKIRIFWGNGDENDQT